MSKEKMNKEELNAEVVKATAEICQALETIDHHYWALGKAVNRALEIPKQSYRKVVEVSTKEES